MDERQLNALFLEYRMAQEMHNYYGRIIWQIGAILLGGGITAFGVVVSRIDKVPSTALLLFAAVLSILFVGFLFLVASKY